MGKPLFFVPVEPIEPDGVLIKGERKRLIHGIASTESRDKHNEEMVVAGMDFDPYIKNGRLNWDHMKGPQYTLGRPIQAEIVPDGSVHRKDLRGPAFYHVCELYDSEPGRAAWDKLRAEKDDPNRQHGFSVEGAILETRGPKLTKTRVEDVALTDKPANGETFAQFYKSLTAGGNPALMMQNLDDGHVTPQAEKALTGIPVEEVLWGECKDGCYDGAGRFRKGASSALWHLVKCKGMEEDRAMKLVKRLRDSGIF